MSTATVRLLQPKDGRSCAHFTTDQKLSSNQDLGVKVATPVGTLIGQLLFGWLADVVGRKRMCESHLDDPDRI